MRISDLATKNIALLGAGREACALRQVLSREVPNLAVDVICEDPNTDINWLRMDLGDRLIIKAFPAAKLSDYDVLIKSPGISLYRNSIRQAVAGKTILCSGTNLWFAENRDQKTICITGTKGKSTSSALLSHLLRAGGERTELAGNIGIPLMERWKTQADFWVIEMSSFQAADFNALADIAVIVSLFAEHLDWHGDENCYIQDKINLLENAKVAVVNAADKRLLQLTEHLPNRVLFNHPDGWQQRNGDIYFAGQLQRKAQQLPLRGHHNASNVCGVLTVIDLLFDEASIAVNAFDSLRAVPDFVSLPHRLQSLGLRQGVEWINDSIATTPAAVVAAIEAVPAESAVILLLGGYERGVGWDIFIRHLQRIWGTSNIYAIIGLPDNGARILREIQAAGLSLPGGYTQAESLKAAVKIAAEIAAEIQQEFTTVKKPQHPIVLLSPGAPSFSEFENFEQRGELFALYAGFS